ncbi:hypothetical protein I350_04331 [Cryptococcus amylolentus CBS 6273]|uniref:Uncharacterized protein n=1 Tax=Cryptococcus amylolentus CBS 6273 TaxID=1296118 RepID=A0A1E3K1C2_9TREE|nr:hypothetical protein I350_04331 [Cryptococcus amylolentus CBS 6273]
MVLDRGLLTALAQANAGEWIMILSLVFGGCCSNVWALEGVLRDHPNSGTFLTFAQFTFVAIQNLSSQLRIVRTRFGWRIPQLKSRKVPLKRWSVQVVLFFLVSLMNNYAFGLKIPVTVHIIFRSGGLCVSMMTGYLVGKRRYSAGQVFAGILITAGIILATLSKPKPPPIMRIQDDGLSTSSSAPIPKVDDTTGRSWISADHEYFLGIVILAGALVLSALLGLYQEQTYKVYGRQWKEALFYGHFLSIPLFSPFYSELVSTYRNYASSAPMTLISLPLPSQSLFTSLKSSPAPPTTSPTLNKLISWQDLLIPSALFALALNLFTQGLCVRGVNRLTTQVNAVTVNLILTVRKAVSLGISVWYYGSGATSGLIIGGGMVLLGTILYSVAPGPKGLPSASVQDKVKSYSQPTLIELEPGTVKLDDLGPAASTGTDVGADPLASAGMRHRPGPLEGTK